MGLCDIPNDWLFLIFDLVDLDTIGSLRRVCARLLEATNKWVERQKTPVYERYVLECVKQHDKVIIQCPNFKGLDECIRKVYELLPQPTHIVYPYCAVPARPFLDTNLPVHPMFDNLGFWRFRAVPDKGVIYCRNHLSPQDIRKFIGTSRYSVERFVAICTSASKHKFEIPVKKIPFLVSGDVFTKFKFNLYGTPSIRTIPNKKYRVITPSLSFDDEGKASSGKGVGYAHLLSVESNNVLIRGDFSYTQLREIFSTFRYITKEPTTITFDLCVYIRKGEYVSNKHPKIFRLKKKINKFLQN